MSVAFDRDALLDAFDSIGRAAAASGTKLRIAVYGGSALMLASNFRSATEDVDVSKLEHPLPDWLERTIAEIAARNGWGADWSQRSRCTPSQSTGRPRRRSSRIRHFPTRRLAART